ncbi:MAG: helix-turn-helix transcriptional regulator [Cellulosimicrobium cellulans]
MTKTTTSAPVPTSASTREALLKRQARGYTQVRGLLVQRPRTMPGPAGERSSTLARFVSERKHRALVLYLLLLGAWPEIEYRIANDRAPLEAQVWVRALTSNHKKALTWSPSTLSRAWTELEDMGLVSRQRRGRLVYVRPRREDGQEDYTRPQGRRGHEHTYFVLPDAFWNDEVFADLGLAALAMFLLIAKETNGTKETHLTYPQIEAWYGIRQRTAQKGIAELLTRELVYVRREHVPAPLSGVGYTIAQHYSLTGDYGYQARAAMRKRAQSERAKRLTPVSAARKGAAKKRLRRAAASTNETTTASKSTKTTKSMKATRAAKATAKTTTGRATMVRGGRGGRERA